jgi:hypothetical protein
MESFYRGSVTKEAALAEPPRPRPLGLGRFLFDYVFRVKGFWVPTKYYSPQQ